MRPQLRTLWYLPLLAAAMGLMMIRLLVMAKVLDVARFGSYSAGLLVSTTFCMLGCLGLQSLLQRDMPIMLARGRARAAMALAAQSVLVASACAAAVMLWPLAGISGMGLPPGLLAIAVLHGLSQQLFLLATVESRSRADPVRYAMQNLWRAVMVVGAGSLVGAATRSAGWTLAAEAVISLALSSGILARACRAAGLSAGAMYRLAIDRRRAIAWQAAGVFLGISLVSSALWNADRWLAASLLPAPEFAQYAFAGVVVLVAQSAQSMINASAFPLLARHFAVQGQYPAYVYGARLSLAMLVAAALAAVPSYFVIRALVLHFYPAYIESLDILWLVLAIGVVRVSDFWSSFLMICGYERGLLALHVVVGIVVTLAWGAAIAWRGSGAVGLVDLATLALLLSFGVHAVAAVVATAVKGNKTP